MRSIMLEIAPGAYSQPHMPSSVRERVWDRLTGWLSHYGQGSVVMTWAAPNMPQR
ncbi:MAG: type I-E CRISPR-associated endoribonuclease Cas2e [Bryobacterales bacterium]|nr:type I-E CRISPR-associated endoribonuclease Cas2e [Bryobacterales bacterium]MDE0295197.1 type I-E CRISPR-associated endoribonuclease Cas2e [Bryobacterales bacterium]MDE0433450.1 type I-E CRISPR-associated endoribonuclease Cas2e [Bryobacterales bacterium]